MTEEPQRVGLTDGDRDVQIDLARSLFFFERANGPEPVTADTKWMEVRGDYLKRSRRLMQALRRAGLAVVRTVPDPTAD